MKGGWRRPHESNRGSKVADAGNQPLRPGSPEYHVCVYVACVWMRIGLACAAWHGHMYVKDVPHLRSVKEHNGELLSNLVNGEWPVFLHC